MAEYYELGARFSKWRATIYITDELPSTYALNANAHALARYAALSFGRRNRGIRFRVLTING